MAYYPKIAELHYKDKQLNITIPVRVKKIVMTDHVCPDCGVTGNLTNMNSEFGYLLGGTKSRSMNLSETKYNAFMNTSVYVKLLASKTQVYCPRCLLNKNKHVVCNIKTKPSYKAYVAMKDKFIRIDKLARQYIGLRWSMRSRDNRIELTAYKNTLEDLYKDLPEKKHEEWITKGKQVRLKVFDVTQKQLEKEYKKYEMRKVARAV